MNPVARGPGDTIEAIESTVPGEWIVDVQWHPELTVGDAVQDRLFREFVNALP